MPQLFESDSFIWFTSNKMTSLKILNWVKTSFLADLLNLLHIKAFKMELPFFFVEILKFRV